MYATALLPAILQLLDPLDLTVAVGSAQGLCASLDYRAVVLPGASADSDTADDLAALFAKWVPQES
jgi:hypothetical protein